MNIISGNCAGTFSGFLAHLAWMEVASNSNNEIKLRLHARNKTNYPGNSYSNYRWFSSTQVNNCDEILQENLLHKFFQPNEYTSGEYPSEFTYFETYPVEVKDAIQKYYPETTLKYEGRGGWAAQYEDLEHLNLTRRAFNKHWNTFKFTEEFDKKVKEEEKLIEGKKVVCLMLRSSMHYAGSTYYSGTTNVLDSAVESVKDMMDDYDAVLLTTQIKPFLDRFVDVFGDKCIYTERERSEIDTDWKGGRDIVMSDEDYETEYRNAMLDVILSSKTNCIIGSGSNMFLAALSMSPEVPFEIFCKEHGM